MERIGVLVVTYGSRGAALVDTFARSEQYRADLYVADRYRNPLNVKAAREQSSANMQLISKKTSRLRKFDAMILRFRLVFV